MEVFYFIWFGIVPPDSCSYNFLSCSAQRVSQTGSGKNNYIRIVFIFFLVYWSCLQRSRGLGAKLRLRYIWLGAQAYIFSLVLATDLLSIVFSSFRSSGLLVLDIKKVPNFGSYTNWLMSRHAGVVYLFGCLSASQMHLFHIFTVVFSYFFCIPASPPPPPPPPPPSLLYDNNTSR